MFSLVPEAVVVESMRSALASRGSGELVVGWIAVLGDRESYSDTLVSAMAADPCVVLPFRGRGFDNANAFLTDLVDFLDRNEEEVRQQLAGVAFQGAAGIVVVAKGPLSVPSLASPVVAPAWFPNLGGRLTHAYVQDLTWEAAVAIGAPESGEADLGWRLYEAESSVIARLQRSWSHYPDRCDRFLAQTRRLGSAPLEVVSGYDQTHRRVANAHAYRPDRKERDNLTSELWRLSDRTSRDRWSDVACALADAFSLPEAMPLSWTPSLLGLLGQGPVRLGDWRRLFCVDLMCLVAAAGQLRQLAGHADNNPAFPIQLTRSVTSEVGRGLACASQMLAVAELALG